jgi:hypothetical protein
VIDQRGRERRFDPHQTLDRKIERQRELLGRLLERRGLFRDLPQA